jgi:hypothetical protein
LYRDWQWVGDTPTFQCEEPTAEEWEWARAMKKQIEINPPVQSTALQSAVQTSEYVPDEVAVYTEKEQTDDENETPIVVVAKKRKILPAHGHASATPAWVNRACELLVKSKIPIDIVALQVRRVAQKNAESVDITGFDVLLELKEERCLDVERIVELQNELNL